MLHSRRRPSEYDFSPTSELQAICITLEFTNDFHGQRSRYHSVDQPDGADLPCCANYLIESTFDTSARRQRGRKSNDKLVFRNRQQHVHTKAGQLLDRKRNYEA